jgi:hypothetical protein
MFTYSHTVQKVGVLSYECVQESKTDTWIETEMPFPFRENAKFRKKFANFLPKLHDIMLLAK